MLLVEIVMPRIISTEYGETPQPVGYTLADCKNYLRRTGDTDDVWIERNSRVAWFQVERYARRLWGSHPDITSRIQIEPNDVLPITVAPLLGVGPINAITNMQRFDLTTGETTDINPFPLIHLETAIQIDEIGIYTLTLSGGLPVPPAPHLYAAQEATYRLLAWALETRARVSWGALLLSGAAEQLQGYRTGY